MEGVILEGAVAKLGLAGREGRVLAGPSGCVRFAKADLGKEGAVVCGAFIGN